VALIWVFTRNSVARLDDTAVPEITLGRAGALRVAAIATVCGVLRPP
jgi:hypothetical protein